MLSAAFEIEYAFVRLGRFAPTSTEPRIDDKNTTFFASLLRMSGRKARIVTTGYSVLNLNSSCRSSKSLSEILLEAPTAATELYTHTSSKVQTGW